MIKNIMNYKFARFLSGGGIAQILEISLLISLVKFLKFNPMFSYAIALITSTIFLFGYHYTITFKVKKLDTGAYPLFFVFALIITILTWSLSFALVNGYNLPYLSTITGTSMSLSLVNYQFNKMVVFI